MNRWQSEHWQAESRAWIFAQLAERGAKVQGELDAFHIRDWSIAIRVPTDQGIFYFKAGAESQAHEAALLKALCGLVPEAIICPVALNLDRGWMLLPDGGSRLREFAGSQPSKPEWTQLLCGFAQLQIKLVNHADELLAAGLPDRRLDKLPSEYSDRIGSREFSETANLGGITRDEFAQLEKMQPQFSEKVEDLAAIRLPASIDHGDLHDGNVFYNGEDMRIFDWGDASLTHPFISLIVPLRILGNYTGFEPESHPELEWARAAYLTPWKESFPEEDVAKAWELALYIGYMQRAMTWYKVASMPGNVEKKEHAKAFVAWLRDFLYYPELPPD